MAINLEQAAKTIYKGTSLKYSYIEAIANSIDSINEKIKIQPDFVGKIDIFVTRDSEEHGKQGKIKSIKIKDNDGIGFNIKNQCSFDTIHSSHKINIGGKGLGHLSWIRETRRANIVSVYEDGKHWYKCLICFTKTYDENRQKYKFITPINNENEQSYCIVRLTGIIDKSINTTESLIKNIVSKFLTKFIESNIQFTLIDDGKTINLNNFFNEEVIYKYNNNEYDKISDTLLNASINIYMIRLKRPFIKESLVAFTAHKRSVREEPLSIYAPFMPKILYDSDLKYNILVWVESELLDERVQSTRINFDNLERDILCENTIEQYITEENRALCNISCCQLLTKLIDLLKKNFKNDITQLNQSKANRIENFIRNDFPHFKLIKDNTQLLEQIPEGELCNKDQLIDRLTKIYIKEKTKVNNIMISAKKTFEKNKNFEQYQQVIIDNMAEVTNIASYELAQYVSHRKTVIDLLNDFVKKTVGTGKTDLEKVIHNVIFPQRVQSHIKKTSIDYFQHNLWLIEERLSFHYALASDVKFNEIGFLNSISSNNRPDILVALANSKYNNEISSFILVEFKRPQRDDYDYTDNPIAQIYGYIENIRNGEFYYDDMLRERQVSINITDTVPIYVYIVADNTKSFLLIRKGYDLVEYKGQENINFLYTYNKTYNAHIKIIPYETLLVEAEQRNRVFFDILGIPK